MGKKQLYIAILIVSTILINSCSTKKNTFVSRAYHNLTAHYNAYFNGREAYKEGLRTLEKSQKDNFTKMLTIFTYEKNENISSVSAKMDRAIEKASKVIKIHSITAKPKREKGTLTESEKLFYSRKEFNNWVDDSYLLMGKAYIYKEDYISSRQNFSFIISQFPDDPIKFSALIWLARTDLIEGKHKNALEILERLEGEKEFPKKLEVDLATTYADYYIKQKKYNEAIPWLKNAISKEKKKLYRIRYTYILAQLYQELKDINKASEYYAKVIKMNPPYEIAFNAKINRATSYDNSSGKGKEISKQLLKMIKDDKNKDYLDQIYYALGNISLKDGNKPKAIEYYKLSTTTSVSNDAQKALSFLNLGKLYFEIPDYLNSQAYYDSCMTFLPKDFPNYEELSAKTLILNELITNLNQVRNQDSLQKVASLSVAERNKLIDGIIQKIREEEARKQIEEQQRMVDNIMFNQNGNNNNNQSETGKWYFYNSTSLSMGKSEFLRKWRSRKLEDNWRRKDKTSVSFDQIAEENQTAIDSSIINTLNPKTREYYMFGLPLTDSLMTISHNKIKEGLFNAGKVYKEKLQDYPKSIETFDELNKRYPKNDNQVESWYYSYQSATYLKDAEKEQKYKNLIINNYPNSNFAKILTNPDYLAELEEQNQKIYNLYERTYQEFKRRDFKKTIEFSNFADSNFVNNQLLSKFLLLKALAIGGTGNVEELKINLNKLLVKYPNSDEKATAEYILARITEENYKNFIPQGQTETNTNANNNIVSADSATTVTPDDIIAQELYKFDENASHLFVIAIENNDVDINRIKFDLTSYNVENFLMFDFDVKKVPFDKTIQFIVVKPFKNKKQASKYLKIILKRSDVFTNLRPIDYKQFIISDTNLETLKNDKDIEKYLRFYKKKY